MQERIDTCFFYIRVMLAIPLGLKEEAGIFSFLPACRKKMLCGCHTGRHLIYVQVMIIRFINDGTVFVRRFVDRVLLVRAEQPLHVCFHGISDSSLWGKVNEKLNCQHMHPKAINEADKSILTPQMISLTEGR